MLLGDVFIIGFTLGVGTMLVLIFLMIQYIKRKDAQAKASIGEVNAGTDR